MPAARTVSLGSSAPMFGSPDLPPALALALEPKVERVVSLELGDVVPQMPAGWVKALNEEDSSRRVLLKAAELERGMAKGNPSVSIATIYRQVPEIFLRPVDASDNAQVRLPFAKVIEQFTKLPLRSDQSRVHPVPQFETPFLKVTLEDNERFGTPNEVLQTDDLPPVRVEPATADSIAAAEPEPVAQEKGPAPVVRFPSEFRLRTAADENGFATPVQAPKQTAPATIAFKLSPIGTDAPDCESVPASNGASVPTSAPLPPPPARIPFKISAPSEDIRPKTEPALAKQGFALEAKTASVAKEATAAEEKKQIRISLPLKPILDAFPPFQLTGDTGAVPEEARIELPFSLVEPQLASGRVCIKPEDFAAALPEDHRALFTSAATAAPVSLPLQEVLKNLPVTALQMRADQEEQEVGVNFETPFSVKADEDAKRFDLSSKATSKPISEPIVAAVEAPQPVSIPEPQTNSEAEVASPGPAPVPLPAPSADNTSEPGKQSDLHRLSESEDEIDAKAIVARVSEMPGLKACAILFADGLVLAGNLPEELKADGLCALAPSMLRRADDHLGKTQFGTLCAMTLSCTNAAITFVMQDNLCLAALHGSGELTPETRARLGCIVQELSRKYSSPV